MKKIMINETIAFAISPSEKKSEPQKRGHLMQRQRHHQPQQGKHSDHIITVKCKPCDILLTGRDQYLGHMIHNHELDYEKLLNIWDQILSAQGA